MKCSANKSTSFYCFTIAKVFFRKAKGFYNVVLKEQIVQRPKKWRLRVLLENDKGKSRPKVPFFDSMLFKESSWSVFIEAWLNKQYNWSLKRLLIKNFIAVVFKHCHDWLNAKSYVMKSLVWAAIISTPVFHLPLQMQVN